MYEATPASTAKEIAMSTVYISNEIIQSERITGPTKIPLFGAHPVARSMYKITFWVAAANLYTFWLVATFAPTALVALSWIWVVPAGYLLIALAVDLLGRRSVHRAYQEGRDRVFAHEHFMASMENEAIDRRARMSTEHAEFMARLDRDREAFQVLAKAR